MSKTWAVFVLAATALGVLTACSGSDSFNTAGSELTSELAQVALESDRITEEIVSAELAAMGSLQAATPTIQNVVTEQRTFSRTRSCPAGGELYVAGTILRTWDPQTRTVEAQVAGERTRTDCAFTVGEGGDVTVVVNGGAMWEKFRRFVDGMPDGLQTSHYSGSWVAVSSTGEERSCTFDYTVVRDPDTMTRTVDGTVCFNGMHRRTGWNPASGG